MVDTFNQALHSTVKYAFLRSVHLDIIKTNSLLLNLKLQIQRHDHLLPSRGRYVRQFNSLPQVEERIKKKKSHILYYQKQTIVHNYFTKRKLFIMFAHECEKVFNRLSCSFSLRFFHEF